MTTTIEIKLGYIHADKVVKVVRVGGGEQVLATLTETGQIFSGAVWDGSELVVVEKDAPKPE